MSDSILDLLGIEGDEFRWEDLAACATFDTEWFYDDYESSDDNARSIDEACLRCPVIAACYNKGQSGGEWGVWGGVYWNGSGKPSVNQNSHKTPETWEAIRKAVGEIE